MKKYFYLFLSILLCLPLAVKADEDGTNVNNGSIITPIGTVTVYAGIESNSQLLDKGYLIADGSSLLRTEYPELFAVIGTTYGNVDSTHFNLPNLKGRTVVGLDDSDNDFKTLGKTGGEKTVTLTVDQIPSHTHTFTGTATDTGVESNSHTHTMSGTTDEAGSHSHNKLWWNSSANSNSISLDTGSTGYKLSWTAAWTTGGGGDSKFITGQSGSHSHTITGATSTADSSHKHTYTATGTNSSTGGGRAHNNMQPYVVMKYIIKVK